MISRSARPVRWAFAASLVFTGSALGAPPMNKAMTPLPVSQPVADFITPPMSPPVKAQTIVTINCCPNRGQLIGNILILTKPVTRGDVGASIPGKIEIGLSSSPLPPTCQGGDSYASQYIYPAIKNLNIIILPQNQAVAGPFLRPSLPGPSGVPWLPPQPATDTAPGTTASASSQGKSASLPGSAPPAAPPGATSGAPPSEPGEPDPETKAESQAESKLTLAKQLDRDGLKDKARSWYRKVIDSYPETRAAQEAKRLLEQGQ
jgi:hypothetical protein